MEQDVTRALRREETITLALRALYEQYGFRKYRMGKFEEYELYMENKNFLKNPNIITFHDLDGRLMALKPDVTLSIAKNTRANTHSTEKVYYLENVYWLEKQSGGYKEVNQLGLESIGRLDAFSYYEVLALAKETLSAISESHRMQVSHIGFWVALLDGLSIEEGLRKELLSCVHGKRLHELKALLDGAGVPPFAAELIVKAASLCGSFPETLAAARGIVNGYPDGTFRPDQPLSTQELAVILYRFSGQTVSDSATAKPGDEVSGYARDAVAWMQEALPHVSVNYGPAEPITRADMAAILLQFSNMGKTKETMS